MIIDQETKKEISKIALETIQNYNKSASFSERKITDTIQNDSLSIVNRKFVSANGTFANRPKAIKGQRYFATDLATNGQPTWYNGTNWVSATGSVLGAGI